MVRETEERGRERKCVGQACREKEKGVEKTEGKGQGQMSGLYKKEPLGKGRSSPFAGKFRGNGWFQVRTQGEPGGQFCFDMFYLSLFGGRSRGSETKHRQQMREAKLVFPMNESPNWLPNAKW